MAELVMLCPSRGRPENAARLARAVARTARPGFTRLVFVLDHDDPELDAYTAALRDGDPSLLIMVTRPDGPRRMGPVLNWAAKQYASVHGYLGFLGDDHLPHTGWWDDQLCAAIGDKPGVAYGNDLFQQAALPTAVVMSAVIPRILGYMSPPPLEHLWIDDFWRTLGEATRLEYLPGVDHRARPPRRGQERPGRDVPAGRGVARADARRQAALGHLARYGMAGGAETAPGGPGMTEVHEWKLFDGDPPGYTTTTFFRDSPWVSPARQAGHAERTAMAARLVADVVTRYEPDTLSDLGCGDGSLLDAIRRPARAGLGV